MGLHIIKSFANEPLRHSLSTARLSRLQNHLCPHAAAGFPHLALQSVEEAGYCLQDPAKQDSLRRAAFSEPCHQYSC